MYTAGIQVLLPQVVVYAVPLYDGEQESNDREEEVGNEEARDVG
jgi:hypothetical protein